MRYHAILTYSEVKMTDSNFSAVISTQYINDFSNLFTNVERVKVSKKHGLNGAKNLYKVYLNRTDLIKEPYIIRRKNGKPDMRFKHINVMAKQQIKFNAFFGTTVN
jgi:hypothetical protein